MAQSERRVKTNLLTAYRCLEKGTVTATGFWRTLNLSSTGALLESPDPLQEGQALELEFLLNDDQRVTVQAHVTGVKHVKAFYNADVAFDELDAQTQRLIDLQTGIKPRSPASKPKTQTKPKPKPKKK